MAVGEPDAAGYQLRSLVINRAGWAWNFKKYNDEERLAKLENAAHEGEQRLWAEEKPPAPWEFRARQKTPQAAPATAKDPKVSYWLNTSSGLRHNQRF